MYARLARFEGSDPAVLERELEQMRKQMQGGMSDQPSGGEGGPSAAQMEEMRKTIKRVLVLADLDKGSSAMVIFCDTEDDVRRMDEMFNQMSPGEGGGKRASVDVYEVAIDDQSG
jgi:hypothetical protein